MISHLFVKYKVRVNTGQPKLHIKLAKASSLALSKDNKIHQPTPLKLLNQHDISHFFNVYKSVKMTAYGFTRGYVLDRLLMTYCPSMNVEVYIHVIHKQAGTLMVYE